jgi:hypothetical protein
VRDLTEKLRRWKMCEEFQVLGERVGCRSCMRALGQEPDAEHSEEAAKKQEGKKKKSWLAKGSLFPGNHIPNVAL